MLLKKIYYLSKEYSILLITGMICALFCKNSDLKEWYEHVIHVPLMTPLVFGNILNLHFLVNDIFMVFFFGVATVEVRNALLPGGSLYPLKKSIPALLATCGGVVMPIIVFIVMTSLFGYHKNIIHGWAIPTATDIAFAWLFAKLIFGNKHPAIDFLLVIAVVDDFIGMGILAVFYPDPHQSVELKYLLVTFSGILFSLLLCAFGSKKSPKWIQKISHSSIGYVLIGGVFSWIGLCTSHLHPALALVPIIFCMPTNKKSSHSFFALNTRGHGAMERFEHVARYIVDIGLLGFGFVNVGVSLLSIGWISVIVWMALLIGKTIGIFCLAKVGYFFFAKNKKDVCIDDKSLFVLSIAGAIGFTVAIFVTGQAYPQGVDSLIDMAHNQAKMGALLSMFNGFIALVVARILGIKRSS